MVMEQCSAYNLHRHRENLKGQERQYSSICCDVIYTYTDYEYE